MIYKKTCVPGRLGSPIDGCGKWKARWLAFLW